MADAETNVPCRRLAMLLPDFRGGGAERVQLDLANAFRAMGHDVEFVVMKARGEFLDEAQRSYRINDLGCSQMRTLPKGLAKYLRNHRPDALFSAMWPLTVIAPIANGFAGNPSRILVSEHNTLSRQYKGWGYMHRLTMRLSMRCCFPFAKARVCVSTGVATDVAELAGMPMSDFEVIHNPIAPPLKVSEDELERGDQFYRNPRAKRLITVGSLKQQKNHSLLLRAFARLTTQNVELLILGSGSLLESLKEEARELKIDQRVIFAGFQPDPAIFYRTADLFVLSSDYEGFGNVIVEALACGTPVVSTDCPSGPAEILEDGRWGYLTPVGDENSLAEAIDASLAEEHDAQALKVRAADFAPAISAKRYLEVLDLA